MKTWYEVRWTRLLSGSRTQREVDSWPAAAHGLAKAEAHLHHVRTLEARGEVLKDGSRVGPSTLHCVMSERLR